MLTHDWMTRKQVAEYLQVGTWTVDQWLKGGILQGGQLVPGGTVRISASSVERLLEQAGQVVAGNLRKSGK